MKKYIKLLLVSSSILAFTSCGGGKSSQDVSSIPSETTESEAVEDGYEKVTSLDGLFRTYARMEDYNFKLDYSYDTVYKRQYYGSYETEYLYDDGTVQMTYLSGDAYYTDYYYENEETDTGIYYIDMGGTKEYQTIHNDNDYFVQFYADIEFVNLKDVDWTEDFVFNKDEKKAKPASENLVNEVCKTLFGDITGEYWDSCVVSYDGSYITGIEAVSIYRESTYYYHIKISNPGWISIELPEATKEYEGYHPYFNDEEYTGTALNEEEKAALECQKEGDPNYTVTALWTYVDDDTLDTSKTATTLSVYADGNESVTYTGADDGLTYTDYLLTNETYGYIAYAGNGDGTFAGPYVYGDDNFSSAISVMAQDQVNIVGLSAEDFIVHGEYFMPKDAETERELCSEIFGSTWGDYYYGLHVYTENGVISKIETSLFLNSSGNIYSYLKVFTFTDVGTTVMTLPEEITGTADEEA